MECTLKSKFLGLAQVCHLWIRGYGRQRLIICAYGEGIPVHIDGRATLNELLNLR